MTQHPMTPPPELFAEWLAQAKRLHPRESTGFIAGEVARLAYQAGADQELEECCEWLDKNDCSHEAHHLRVARRPKPSSLKEQALIEFDSLLGDSEHEGAAIIRHALEQLPDPS